MEPDEASTSTTGPAPMNALPHGPRSRAESGEHGIPVDAEPDEVEPSSVPGPEVRTSDGRIGSFEPGDDGTGADDADQH